MKTQINTRLPNHLNFFSRVFAVLVFLIGVFAVWGWQFDVEMFKKVKSGLPIIAPNTACFFIPIGLFIFFLNWAKENYKPLQILARLFSFLIAILGAATLMEYIFKINLGIDAMFFPRKMGENIIRMSPQSAFNFLLVGLSLFFYSWKDKKRILWGQIAIVAAGITALVSLFGFIYGVSGLYTIAPYKGMAVHTAVGFVAAFFGILTAYPEIGLVKIFISRGFSGMAARKLLLALLAILVIEILVMLGGRAGWYSFSHESLVHLIIVTGVFIFLIFYSFRSLDKLAEAEKSIEYFKEVDKAKTEFISLASHQLRTPLSAVNWYAEMLLAGDVGRLNKEQKKYINEMYKGNERMVDLVNALLNVSRLEFGTFMVEPEPTDVVKLAQSVINEQKQQIIEKKLKLSKKYSNNLPRLNADPRLLRIVFQNLLSNAVKYTPSEGMIKVGVRLVRRGESVDNLKAKEDSFAIVVSDTGYGIPKGQQGKIFTKFFRADNVREKDTEGTGLDLYIVKAIINLSGGAIWFESEESKGTTFYASLPLRGMRKKEGTKTIA